jgi:hypothetical protein
VRLGSQDPGQRLKIALDTLDVYKQTPRGNAITYVDLQTGRVVIGFSSGNKVASDSPDLATQTPAQTSTSNTNANTNVGERKIPSEKSSANDNRQRNERKPAPPKDSPTTGTGRFR